MHPLGKVKIKWSPEFAYAIGLLTTDGNLSPDKRHINFTSKDKKLVETLKKCLKIKNKIGRKSRGYEKEKKYFVIQFGDVRFYKFLMIIGLTPNKSKTLRGVKIPSRYLFDFLRGHFDGDGTFYSYWDPRWKSSFMFYLYFYSASKQHILWLQNMIYKKLTIRGHVVKSRTQSVYALRYAKKDTLALLKKIYYNSCVVCLARKRLKIMKVLSIIGEQL